MAFVAIVIEVPNDSIDQLNSDLQRPGKPHEAVNNVRNLCKALVGGLKGGTVQVTTLDSDPGVSTSGTHSEQESYDLT